MARKTDHMKGKKLTNIGACDEAWCVEVDANEFALNLEMGLDFNLRQRLKKKTYETWGVVILDSLGVTKCFQDRIGLQQLLLQFTLRNYRLNVRI